MQSYAAPQKCTLNDVLACSAPLIISDVDGENPFFSGTCFRVSFEDRVYVVTARHCIKNSSINFETQRVECATPEQGYLPLKSWHLLGTKLDDTDHSDIAIFEVDLDRMSAQEKRIIPTLDIAAYPLPKDYRPAYKLIVEGFPFRLSEWNGEQKSWKRGSEKLEARYEGPSENELGTSKLTFKEPETAEDIEGLSGAPVFAFKNLGPKTFLVGFAGMMIRTNYFINADIIVTALKWLKTRTAPSTA
jgi:hypothetical protein